MATLTEYRTRRNKILKAIINKNEIFAVAEIRDETLESRDVIRIILYRLKEMSYVIRQRNGYHYKVWERTSLMPSNLEVLIKNYENIIELKQAARTRH